MLSELQLVIACCINRIRGHQLKYMYPWNRLFTKSTNSMPRNTVSLKPQYPDVWYHYRNYWKPIFIIRSSLIWFNVIQSSPIICFYSSLWLCVYVLCVLYFVGMYFVTCLRLFIRLRSVLISRCGPRRTTLWSRSGRWCWTGTPTTTLLRWNRSPSPLLTSSRGWRLALTRCYRYCTNKYNHSVTLTVHSRGMVNC